MLSYQVKLLFIACHLRGLFLQQVELSTPQAQVEVGENFTLLCSFKAHVCCTSWVRNRNVTKNPLIGNKGSRCIASGFLNDTKVYSWKCFDNNTHSLTLKQVRRNQHNETWSCLVTVDEGKSVTDYPSQTIYTYVKVPVQSVTLQSDVTNRPVKENQFITFSCNTSYSRPPPKVLWYFDKGTDSKTDDLKITFNVSDGIEEKADSYSIANAGVVYSTWSTLTHLTKRNENNWGIYCLTSNIDGKNHSSLKSVLNVTYHPDSPVIQGFTNDTYKIIEHEITNLSCSVLGGNPLPDISFSCSISAEVRRLNSSTRRDMLWNVTQEQNSKTCICTAIQSNWRRTLNVILEVLYPPNIPTISWSYTSVNKIFTDTFLKVIANMSIKLTCIAYSNPKPRYKWTRQILLESNMLEFKRISPGDKGVYTCHAFNRMHPSSGEVVNGSSNKAVTIDVLYAPEVHTLQNISVIEGNNIAITCNTTLGNPNITDFEWISNNHFRNGQQQMELINVSRDRTGVYKCTATNTMKPSRGNETVGKSSKFLHLTVLYPPNIPSISLTYNTTTFSYNVSQNVSIIENKTFTLRCTAHGEPTPLNYSWTTSWSLLHHENAELKINVVERQHSGEYKCYAKNNMTETSGKTKPGENTSSIHIDILYPPMIGELSNESVLEGSALKKLCILKDEGNPHTLNFTWTRVADKKTWDKKKLYINKVSRRDSMRYTCSVYNEMSSTYDNHTEKGESSKSFHLDVVYSASVREFAFFTNGGNIISTVNETQNFRITCIVDSNPSPNVSIFLPSGKEYTEVGLHNLSIVEHATCFHAGTYRCKGLNMHNNNQDDLREENLFVRCPPRPSDNMAHNRTIVTSARHDSAFLSFTAKPFYDQKPTHFVWKKIMDSELKDIHFNENIQVSSSGSQSNLTVVRMSESDYGEYLLIYSNSVGTSNYTFVIDEVSELEAEPTQSSNSNTVVAVLTTGILAGIVAFIIVAVYFYRKRNNKDTRREYQNVSFSGNQNIIQRRRASSHMEETLFEGLQEVDDVSMITKERTEYCNSPDMIEKIDRIKVTELFSYVSDRSEESFEADYQKLPTELQKPCTFARKPENIALNRYNGIYPYDHSRVKLHGQPDFFINACYIDGYKRSKAYIASLGPTAKTTSDFSTFWKMIWYERADIIVMLTNLREPSGMKCEKYWPEGGDSISYGDVSVSSKAMECFAEYTIRTFSCSKDDEHRLLTHLHYTAWPDKTVPEDVTSLIEFRQRLKATPTSSEGPIVVHCSAGIGRTGTLIALDRLIEEGQDQGSLNVFECVNNMREQRVKMVQTFEQYMYIYKALVNALTFDCETIPVETFNEYVDATNNNMYSMLFQQLRQSVETDSKADLEARSKNEKLTNKNRLGVDIPGNRFRAMLYLNRTDEGSEYINAIYINSFVKKDYFIAAQSPLPCTVADFITMVYQEDCSCIATMEDLKDPGMTVGQYLPDDKKTLTVGNFKVSSSRLETKHNYVVRKMKIKYSGKIDSGEKTIYHFQYTKWMTGHDTPVDVREFVQFVNEVKVYANELGEERSHVIVHCLKANERSGLFCALAILMEKIKLERQVNVLNTLRHLRTRRQTAITSMEQLKFCYQATSAYIKMNMLG